MHYSESDNEKTYLIAIVTLFWREKALTLHIKQSIIKGVTKLIMLLPGDVVFWTKHFILFNERPGNKMMNFL